jgi:endonuclease/exonuclease/phosphatase family metal-dependent hydrolase
MRILSYNIHKGIGGRDRRYSFERIVAVIEEENPDLICLQEVDRHCQRSANDDQPRRLAEHFRVAAHLFQLNVHARSGGGYGNLLLSRWPFVEQHQISLRLRQRKPVRKSRSSTRSRDRCGWHIFIWACRNVSGIGKSSTCWGITCLRRSTRCRPC